jgi:multidrug efflux pump subunit AcrA (membrane-fusion protein)
MRRFVLLLLLVLCGCGTSAPPTAQPVSTLPRVRLVHPTVRDLERAIGQPSFIDAYEQTAIYAKLPGYVLKWNVDIGDLLTENQLLATLFIPELKEEVSVKTAQVEMDGALVRQAQKLVDVARGNLRAAEAQVAEAKANVGKFEALVERWESEVARQRKMVEEDVLDRQILDESIRQLQSSIASRDAAVAAVDTAEADRLARAADLEKATVDVDVASARLDVATSDEKRVQALYGYTRLLAPYKGIVVLRNANTGDFVLPATGDPSAATRTVDQSAAGATPIYVVARTDIVRVYVDVPEVDANHIVSRVAHDAGDPRAVTKASVLVPAYQDAELPAEVTRSSWALNFKSRTLRAEIDLDNPDARLLPGMYAYGKVCFERKGARALPRAAVTEIGNQTCCYVHHDGRAVRTPIETGVRAGDWIEVVKKQVGGQWLDFDGHEPVILGDMSELFDGEKVVVQR